MNRNMLQDMTKGMILQNIANRLICNGRTQVRLWAYSSSLKGVLRIMFLLLILTLGAGTAWGQLFTVTTDTDNSGTIEESEKHYYLIQSAQILSFYMIPSSNNTNVTTTNVPNENMRWYFMDAGEDSGIQYYYIIHQSGKYMYRKNNNNDGIQLTTAGTTDDRKFYIETTGDYYFIRPKGESYVNKKGGNVNPNTTLKNSTATDNASKWKFIDASTSLSWTFPFTPSTNAAKTYYKIKNDVYQTFLFR